MIVHHSDKAEERKKGGNEEFYLLFGVKFPVELSVRANMLIQKGI